MSYLPAPPYLEEMRILGLKLHPVSASQVHDYIRSVIEKNEKALVLNLNVHCVNLALKYAWLFDFLNSAQMIFCDGDGVRWGIKLLGMNPPPKITYASWIWELSEFCQERGLSLYFLGAKSGVAEAAAKKLIEKYPRLKIAGTHHGYFNRKSEENTKIITEINSLKPDILVMGVGMPIQEEWLKDHWRLLDAHIFLTGGAVFDYTSGLLKRAPDWMIRLHLEWLFRFIQEPKRLFVRYIFGNPVFIFRVLKEKMLRR